MSSGTALIFSSIDDSEINWLFGSGEFDPGVDKLSSEEDKDDDEEEEEEEEDKGGEGKGDGGLDM
jgi:hypothetical protein